MPARDYGFTLEGVDFGIGEDITVESFDPGAAEWRVQDAENPVRDGLMFGVDYLGAPTWAFNLSTDGTDAASALEMLAPLAAVWRGGTVRTRPGEVSALIYKVAGRLRRVYGRPRRWAAPPTNRILSGYIPIVADFATVDALHYNEAEQSSVVDIVPGSTGGFTTPLIAPISTHAGGQREGFIDVEGDMPTWPVIRIDGPISTPFVAISGKWEVRLNMTIPEDDFVEIDARPWAMSVLRSGVSNAAGFLAPTSRMNEMKLPVGQQEIVFGGVDSTGTARCTITWRPAWNTL